MGPLPSGLPTAPSPAAAREGESTCYYGAEVGKSTGHCEAAVRARWRRSDVIGISVRRTPVASLIALPIAAAPGMTGGSPTPRTPNGPDFDATSNRIVSIGGILSAEGRA